MKIVLVAGARPNFVKIAPILYQLEKAKNNGSKVQFRLVHTGQHYDKRMSDSFFFDLNIPLPDINLNCGGGTQSEQTAAILIAFERELTLNPADLVIVVGDVTSTMACAIVAKKMNIKVAHIEAGIRSFDLTMPEEINQMVTDSITDYFFTTSMTANKNLLRFGVLKEQIFFVGNVMIDTLLKNRKRFSKPRCFDEFGLKRGKYIVLTLHRPNNVDEIEHLKELVNKIMDNTRNLPVIFPIHPRTAKLFSEAGIKSERLKIIEPLGYLEFNYLVQSSKAVITDSGGISEETTILNIPCLTLRNNTERPETVSLGTNVLVGTSPSKIKPILDILFTQKWKQAIRPEHWDGKASRRIIDIILKKQA